MVVAAWVSVVLVVVVSTLDRSLARSSDNQLQCRGVAFVAVAAEPSAQCLIVRYDAEARPPGGRADHTDPRRHRSAFDRRAGVKGIAAAPALSSRRLAARYPATARSMSRTLEW